MSDSIESHPEPPKRSKVRKADTELDMDDIDLENSELEASMINCFVRLAIKHFCQNKCFENPII